MTRRVLLAWEMGEGLGHAARLLLLATRLRDIGWQPTVAARDVAALADRYAAAGVAVVPAPAHRSQYSGAAPFRAATFADVMGVCGYAGRGALAASVAAWDAVLDAQRPDLVIADYSPLLSLAAFGRLPLVAIGDGFVTPPGLADGTFPAMGDPAPPVWPAADLLANARAVQAARGRALPDTLPAIMHGVGQVVAVPPEIDIYADHRRAPAAGPWEPPHGPLPPPKAPPRFFAYLHAGDETARRLLAAAARGGVPMDVFLRDAPAGFLADLAACGLRVHSRPPPLRAALATCALLIHHGGIGSLAEAAYAGRPQVILPRQLEQRLNARRALQTLPGVAILKRDADLDRALARLAADTGPAARARQASLRLAQRPGGAWPALLTLIDQAADS